MGEVFDALQLLNQTFKLNLSAMDVLRAEGMFKSELARRANFPKEYLTDQQALVSNWEIMTYLKPRERPLSMRELNTLAQQAVKGSTAGATLTTGKLATGAVKRGAEASPRKAAKKTTRKKKAE